VTATRSWPNFPSREGIEVDYQVAAPTESSTPNLHRATIAQQRVRMEGWRQRWLGSEPKTHLRKTKIVLTRTGLLMEGPIRFAKAEGRSEDNFRRADHPPTQILQRKVGQVEYATHRHT
jgi:hypothetical protein